MQTTVRVGEKGQILIPKLLREEYGILPGQPAQLKETPEGLLLTKMQQDPIELLRGIAKKLRMKKIDVHALEQQYADRLKRAGL